MEENKTSFIDRLGPTLTSGLIIAALSAVSLGAVAIRDLVITSDMDIAYLKSEFARHRDDFEKFKSPGSRFTADDGKRLQAEIKELEARIHSVELRQAEICERVKNCNGYPSTGYTGTNRSGNQGTR